MWIFCFCSVPPLLKNELSNMYFNNFLDMWPVLAARCKCSLSCSKSTSLSVWTVHCVTVSTGKWAVCTCAMLNRGCALCERKIRHSVTCKYSWLNSSTLQHVCGESVRQRCGSKTRCLKISAVIELKSTRPSRDTPFHWRFLLKLHKMVFKNPV